MNKTIIYGKKFKLLYLVIDLENAYYRKEIWSNDKF